jgi:hypothetical protein
MVGKLLLPTQKIDPIRTNFHPDFSPEDSNGWDALICLPEILKTPCNIPPTVLAQQRNSHIRAA